MKLYNTYGDLLIDYKDCETVKDAAEKAVANDANLRNADLFFADLRGAIIRRADFSGAFLCGARMHRADFSGANFSDVDFSRADLRDADFSDANFSGATFRGAKFSDAKIRGAILPFDKYDVPIIIDIHKKVFAACSVKETFNMKYWCGTAKCIAGWVCAIAGGKGIALAKEIGFDAAVSLIYMRSDPKLERIPDYYASNEDALENLKKLANKRG